MTSRLPVNKGVNRLSVYKAGGVRVTPKRDSYNPNYGGGGEIAPYLLKYAPPVLTDPTTIKVTNATVSVNMDPTKDYIILLPGAKGNDLQSTPHQSLNPTSSALSFIGGRNVVMIGGAIRRDIDQAAGEYVRTSSKFRAVRNRGMYLADWTGVFHIEGVYFGGQHLYETVNISTTAATAKLVWQNICVDTLVLKTPDTYGNSNHDGGDAGIQNWDGPAGGMYVDHFSIKGTTYQGFFMQPAQFGSKVPAENIIENVDISYNDPAVFNPERRLPWPYQNSKFGTGVQMFCFSKELDRQGPTTLNNIYLHIPPTGTYSDPTVVVAPDKSDTTNTLGQNPKPSYNATTKVITWPGLPWVTGSINIGKPAQPFVKPSYVGTGYVSPGYITSGVTAPTTAPTVTTAAGVQKVDLSWTSVANATSYKVYRSTTATVTTSSTLLGTVTSQQYTDPGLTAGTTYYYAVLGNNSQGDGPLSAVKSAIPTAPQSSAGTFFADDFNRADSLVAGNWYDSESLYKVVSNTCGIPTTGGLSNTAAESKFLMAAIPAPGTGSYSFAIDVTAASTNTTKLHPRVLVGETSESDRSSYYQAYYVDSTTVASRKWVLQKVVFTDGVATTTELASDTTNVSIGQTRPYTLELRKNGTLLEVRVNSTLVIAYTDSSPLSGRYCGILTRQGGASGAINQTITQRFDNATGKTY